MPKTTPLAERTRRPSKGWGQIWVVVRWVSLMLALVFAAGIKWATQHVFPYAIVGTDRTQRTQMYRSVTPASLNLRSDPFQCEVDSGVVLRGWFLPSEGTARGTILMLHGHNGCKEALLRLGKLFVGQGYNALLYDSRGHGESGGEFCTYGYYERRDCSRCLDEAARRYGAALGPVAIYGSSFGGAVALQAMADDPRFRCGVVESTFATLREIVRDYEQHFSGVRLDSLTDEALENAGVLARFPPNEVNPEQAARRIRCPVLLIHGTADTDISIHYGERIFRNLPPMPGREWYPVPGAKHTDLWIIGGERYRNHILDFIARWDH